MTVRFLIATLFICFLFGSTSLSHKAYAQVDLLSAQPLIEDIKYTPPYQDDIDSFNAISDDELIAELTPLDQSTPSEDDLDEITQATDTDEAIANQEPKKASDDPVSASDLERYALVPQYVLDDAQDFFRYCEQSPSLKTHYQCTCWAKRYLDTSIELGPGYKRADVIKVINNDCLDIPRMAGIYYSQCLKQSLVEPQGQSMEDYCACYGNEYAKNIQKGTLHMGSQKISAAQSLAMDACL